MEGVDIRFWYFKFCRFGFFLFSGIFWVEERFWLGVSRVFWRKVGRRMVGGEGF